MIPTDYGSTFVQLAAAHPNPLTSPDSPRVRHEPRSRETMTTSTAERLGEVRRGVAAAASVAGRHAADVDILAVSKGQPDGTVRELEALGVRRFGESYVSEAVPKIQALADLELEWYFLGQIQRNKTRPIAENFQWVLALSSEGVARRLSDQRPDSLGPLQACIQVNIDADENKAGVRPDEVERLADRVANLPNLQIRGLMTITRIRCPGDSDDSPFRELATLFDNYVARGRPWDTLSMGMSGDFGKAIGAGSTQVRIGTALFGPRPLRPRAG